MNHEPYLKLVPPDHPVTADRGTSARVSAADLAAFAALDTLFEQIDSDQMQRSGAGGLLPELSKAVLERDLQTEMTGHLRYERGDPVAGLITDSRNGGRDKTIASEGGSVPLRDTRHHLASTVGTDLSHETLNKIVTRRSTRSSTRSVRRS